MRTEQPIPHTEPNNAEDNTAPRPASRTDPPSTADAYRNLQQLNRDGAKLGKKAAWPLWVSMAHGIAWGALFANVGIADLSIDLKLLAVFILFEAITIIPDERRKRMRRTAWMGNRAIILNYTLTTVVAVIMILAESVMREQARLLGGGEPFSLTIVRYGVLPVLGAAAIVLLTWMREREIARLIASRHNPDAGVTP
ncbi:hypothetical protein [Bifidobacterium callimiconis]|uniref:Uncharacterized protein n=1 Tax=Bifidobacterium callimiconis TaxID=2306973 RepID=A0A430F830_9BIFI|nr:hypothetical protein [Bifidobacterium callimiconis]MBT1177101.1 hypothetical protein [Bifidobacterium callimiconis]RSX49034.1 hypothetical protein D2E23_2144 [Bifidobacterium callimiconis]